ncbi:hypothetical protein GLYMA_15G085600v4 [Glycine max]|uniref:Uncharacterized protein n=1 Tax=Glycine max TaxID=3847 RepID=K7MAD1_SOYBN|nr:hypothetical protein GYH30_041761 [Glycine max]KRH11054.1 hypothetical protein GLYMA_15G085600v4 [Glycine max]
MTEQFSFGRENMHKHSSDVRKMDSEEIQF